MLPGMGKMKDQLENFDEREIVHTEAIIQSMTQAERQNPKILNGSRRLRIAKGSGMTVTDVNSLVSRFEQAAKMMKTVAKGGVPQIPGMGVVPGMGGGYAGKRKQQPKGKAKGAKRSGNPAKRAAEAGGQPAAPSGGGSGFGLGAGGSAQPSETDLAQLQNMLGKGLR
jgi:signal recognition particle subunit SRP54